MKKFFFKAISIFLSVSILGQCLLLPTATFAMSGAVQPEFSSFESVNVSNMVDEFTGDYTYTLPLVNIPGPNGSGYAMALSYKSNLVPEEDASWVGYGWNLSAGAITRSVYGLPDDMNGGELTYTHKSPSNISVGVTLNGSLSTEAFGVEGPISGGASVTTTFQYNNIKKACAWTTGLSTSVSCGIASLSLSASNHQLSFDPRLSPLAMFDMNGVPVNSIAGKIGGAFGNSGWLDYSLTMMENRSDRRFPCLSYPPKNDHGYNTDFLEYEGHLYQMELDLEANTFPIPVGPIAGMKGFYSIQTPIETINKNIYGFLYSHNAGDADVMDYHTEHDKPYNKRDNFLAIPFSQPDQYIIMAQDVSGICRPFSRKAGTFHLPSKESSTSIDQIGGDVLGGLCNGLGLSYSTGNHVMETSTWEPDETYADFNFSDEGDEPYFFALIGDPACNMTYNASFSAQDHSNPDDWYNDNGVSSAKITNPSNTWVPGFMNYTPSLEDASFFKDEVNEGTDFENQRIERSTYITYNTNREMMEADASGIYYKRYNKRTDMGGTFIERDLDDIIRDQIGEFSVTNTNGSSYVFGLPVYVRNETQMSYGLTDDDNDNLVYTRVTNKAKKIGTVNNEPYPVSHLLTQITTPDYIDRSMDGPSNDDFGGWTKFNYTRLYGDDNKRSTTSDWYVSRTPYCGLKNSRGRISDLEDNTGTMSSIEKEIYNLASVETKTHIAIFNTSSRDDAYDANTDEDDAATGNVIGSNGLQKLDNIKIYVKDESGTASSLIETIYFEYDYSLMPGQKNNQNAYSSGSYSASASNSGKLTLRKVWKEFTNVKNAGIAPYEFIYKYPSNTVAITDENYAEYPSQYSSLNNYGSGLTENPAYADAIQNRWGNYCEDFDIDAPYVDQNPSSSFDPAAWCLKMIKLPSGGQIHVQYEQDDYSFVHDQSAMAMVGIDYVQSEGYTGGAAVTQEETKATRYYLDVENSLGYTDDAQVENLANLIRKEFTRPYDNEQSGPDVVGLYHKLYFRYLYNLTTTSCAQEFIDGYFVITQVEVESVEGAIDKIYIKLSDDTNNEEIEYESDEYKYPRQACFDFCNTERVGAIDFSDGSCNEGDPMGLNEISDEDLLINQISDVVTKMVDPAYAFLQSSACVSIDVTDDGEGIPAYSFMRLPIPSKKGGGIRVKRLLMYDLGLENVPSLQGHEYIYKLQEDESGNSDLDLSDGLNGKSSGVAANEPSIGREENSLIGFLDQYQESLTWADKIVSGVDIEQFEGPIGESLLPGPSVGYSNVIIKNIFEGDNNAGYSQSQFHTYKDSPFVVYDMTSLEQQTDILTINTSWVQTNIDKVWATQGYRFVVHNEHGKPKSKKLFSIHGDCSYSETYEYGELHTEYDESPNDQPIGCQSEAFIETRQVSDVLDQITFEADASVGLVGVDPVLYVTLVPTLTYNESRLFTHVSNQIDYRTTFLFGKTVIQNGITKNYEYVVFDDYSGENTMASTSGSFQDNIINGVTNSDKYYTKNYLGKDYYPSLQGKYENEMKVISSTDAITISKIDNGGGNALLIFTANDEDVDLCPELESLNPGDLINVIYVNSDGSLSSEASIYNILSAQGNTITIQENSAFSNSYTISWDKVNVEILRSGNTNQLSSTIGNVTTYGTAFEEVEHSVREQVGEDNWAAREALASDLNALLNGSGTVTLSYSELTATNAIGNCEKLNTSVTATPYSYSYSGTYSYLQDTYSSSFTNDGTLFSFNGDCSIRAQEGGHFEVDENTGEIVYYEPGNSCSPIAISCIDFCPDYYPYITIEGVVDAAAISLSDDWDYSSIASKIGISTSASENDYQLAYKGQWHPKSAYTYTTGISDYGGSANTRIYEAGIFDEFTLYNWEYEDAVDPEKWLLTNTSNIYSPYNKSIEEVNVLDVKSVAKFLNDYSIPYLTAVNSDYENVMAESFETANASISVNCEDGWNAGIVFDGFALSSNAHSGSQSLQLGMTPVFLWETTSLSLNEIVINDQIKEHGITVKFWLMVDGSDSDPSGMLLKADHPTTSAYNQSENFEKVARVGEWTLYQATISSFTNFSTNFTPYISVLMPSTTASLYIDDIRMQPGNAQSSAYVYDLNKLRPIAEFDDQNFGLYYQYNDEGKLIRKLVETERGVKTVSETLYNIPLSER